MNLGEILAKCRILGMTPSTARWTPANMTILANDASVQLALDIDFPQATFQFATLVAPAQPTITQSGATGTTPYYYSVVQSTDYADSAPSPAKNLAAGNATLDGTNYNIITWPSVPGYTYLILRSTDSGATYQLLTSVTAAATSTTVDDKGAFAPTSYLMRRGNEYQVPEWIKQLRAYVVTPNGGMQPLVPYDIPTLGGDVDETFDQSSTINPGLPAYTPQWIAQPPAAYPVPSQNGGIVPVSIPWSNTTNGRQRPGYYMRGGYMGILPAPLSVMTINYDYIPLPPQMQQSSDESIFPNSFKDTLCYKMLEYMALAEDTTNSDNYASRYMMSARKLRVWNDNQIVNKPHSLVPMTKRTASRSWPTGR